jgi:hypothetical protein
MRFPARGGLFLLVIAIGYLAYAERFQLAAKTWHRRPGLRARMGNYDAPVPEHGLSGKIHNRRQTAFSTPIRMADQEAMK